MLIELLAVTSATKSENAHGLLVAAVWFALIFVVLAATVKLVQRYRQHGSFLGRLDGRDAQDQDDPGELLTKFRDLHSRGTLSDVEYRTIKTKLATQIQTELNPNGSELNPNGATKQLD